MNVTFLIGNGFDLRLGMKTRFTDMYEGYVSQPSSSDAISNFKKRLKADAPEYKTWGDFEVAMAQKAKDFGEEKIFIECLRDFKIYMAECLRKEQAAFKRKVFASSRQVRERCAAEFSNSIDNFYVGLTPNAMNEFMGLGVADHPSYNFVSFNYTDVFDVLLNHVRPIEEVIHVHGRLDAEIVLGADNLAQVKDLPYQTTKRFERAFIKPEFNRGYDSVRTEKAIAAIENSDIICIYGMSLGESDFSWVTKLKEWLLSDRNHHLVRFVFDQRSFNKLNWDEIIDEEEDRIAELLGTLCNSGEEMGQIFNQIHIPVSYDLFGLNRIVLDEQAKKDEEDKRKEEMRKRLSEERERVLP